MYVQLCLCLPSEDRVQNGRTTRCLEDVQVILETSKSQVKGTFIHLLLIVDLNWLIQV